jgi:hypothetical protein
VMRKMLTFLLLPFIAIGCTTHMKRMDLSVPPTKQVVLFHYSFMNAAWGYQNRGWFVDNRGLVKAYWVHDPKVWHQPIQSGPDSGYISKQDLLADYSLADKVFFNYSYFDINDKIKFIDKAAAGTLSVPTRTAYDAGQNKYSTYYWDEAKGMYKEVVLNITGDWTQTNLSAAADTLYDWLRGLEPFYQDSLRVWQP